jgi:nuclear pore complex protein Nup205
MLDLKHIEEYFFPSRFMGIFKFVYEDVFGPFPQRAYGDPREKWELALACLEHFRL